MVYVLRGTVRDKAECKLIEVPYDEFGNYLDTGKPESPTPAGIIQAWLKPLTGRDMREINDNMSETDRRGKTKYRSGSSAKSKVCRAIFELGGIEDEHGNAITSMSGDVFDILKASIINKFLIEIDIMSGDDDVMEKERQGE